MRLLTRLSNYVNEKEYQIIITNNIVNIINYHEIKEFSSTKIIVSYTNGRTIIEGNNLVVGKMLENEIKITGVISNIILR